MPVSSRYCLAGLTSSGCWLGGVATLRCSKVNNIKVCGCGQGGGSVPPRMNGGGLPANTG